MKDLEEIFRVQQDFESLFVDFQRIRQGDSHYLDEAAGYLAMALAKEAFEFRDEFNWKLLGKNKLHNRDKQIEEAIDCFVFSINLLLILGADAEECLEIYRHKTKINWERQLEAGNEEAISRYSERAKSGDLEMYFMPSVSVSLDARLLPERD